MKNTTWHFSVKNPVNYAKWKQLLCPFPILIEIPSSTIDTAVHEMKNTQSIGVKNSVDFSK